MGFLAAFAALVFIIVIHELGHLLMAKLFGVWVRRFSIGFGPVLWSKKAGDTTYQFAAIPLGGFVDMVGEKDGDTEAGSARSLSEKPVWQRLSIVLAGPFFNFLLALVVFSFAYTTFGVPVGVAPKITQLVSQGPADRAGIKAGDVILAVDGVPVKSLEEVIARFREGGNEVLLLVRRENVPQALEIRVVPERREGRNFLGIYGGELLLEKRGPLAAITQGAKNVAVMVTGSAIFLGKLVTGGASSAGSIMGPIGIVSAGATSVSLGGLVGWLLYLAAISVAVGFMNLLPVPVLDGGHVPFLLLEGIRKKPVSKRTREVATRIGVGMILFLFALGVFNDLARLTGK